jgi:hypothetical protein
MANMKNQQYVANRKLTDQLAQKDREITALRQHMQSQQHELPAIEGPPQAESRSPVAPSPLQSNATPFVPRQYFPSQRQRSRPLICWNCGDEGHPSRLCPATARAPNKYEPSGGHNGNNGIHADFAKVYLPASYKGVPISCLLDTGSDLTLAPYHLVERHHWKLTRLDIPNLTAANGTSIQMMGSVEVPSTLLVRG